MYIKKDRACVNGFDLKFEEPRRGAARGRISPLSRCAMEAKADMYYPSWLLTLVMVWMGVWLGSIRGGRKGSTPYWTAHWRLLYLLTCLLTYWLTYLLT